MKSKENNFFKFLPNAFPKKQKCKQIRKLFFFAIIEKIKKRDEGKEGGGGMKSVCMA